MMIAADVSFDKVERMMSQTLAYIVKAADKGERADLVEREVFHRMVRFGLMLMETYFDRAGHGDEGKTVERDGRKLRRFRGRRTRWYRSIFGAIKISRWVYGIREGQKAEYLPLDAHLGLPEGEQSYVLEDWLQRLCVQNAFSTAVSSLDQLLGIRTSVRTAERINRELASHAEDFRESQGEIDPDQEEEVLVVAADGKGVPMRRTLEERAGCKEPAWRRHRRKKQQEQAGDRATKRLTRGQTRTHKQMAYVGAVYSIQRWRRSADDVLDEVLRKKKRLKRPKPRNKRVWAEMTNYVEGSRCDGKPRLFQGLAREAAARDPQAKKPLVCLMDGQRDLWLRKREWLGRAIEILDIFHAIEYLWKAAYCFHGEGSRAAEEFVTHYLRMLLEGKVGYAIGSLRRKLANISSAKQKTLESVIQYFQNNRDAMKYHQYLKAGYPIGSGAVEGACRYLVRDRMERTGMRWDIEGAQAMLHTRACFVNGQWDEFIEHRIQTEQARLYAQAA